MTNPMTDKIEEGRPAIDVEPNDYLYIGGAPLTVRIRHGVAWKRLSSRLRLALIRWLVGPSPLVMNVHMKALKMGGYHLKGAAMIDVTIDASEMLE